jgi:hypothetical protein
MLIELSFVIMLLFSTRSQSTLTSNGNSHRVNSIIVEYDRSRRICVCSQRKQTDDYRHDDCPTCTSNYCLSCCIRRSTCSMCHSVVVVHANKRRTRVHMCSSATLLVVSTMIIANLPVLLNPVRCNAAVSKPAKLS